MPVIPEISRLIIELRPLSVIARLQGRGHKEWRVQQSIDNLVHRTALGNGDPITLCRSPALYARFCHAVRQRIAIAWTC